MEKSIQRPVQKAEDLQNIVLTVFEDIKNKRIRHLLITLKNSIKQILLISEFHLMK
jgi:histidinol dehydrogenase